MTRIATLFLTLLVTSPAFAHSLKVFAKVDGKEVSGYAFFVGGGRPMAVTWVAKMGDKPVATGKTGNEGEYRFSAPDQVTDAISITVDTGEGHIATTQLKPDRFGIAADAVPAASTPDAVSSGVQEAGAAGPSPDETARLVEVAVERQIGPLLERIEEMDARMRFTDIMSGIFLIIGLAGMALWARGRTR